MLLRKADHQKPSEVHVHPMGMGHSCRCNVHPALTLLVLATIGSVIGFGVQVWLEPWTTTVALAIGSFAGMLVSHALGEKMVLGFAWGIIAVMLVLGVRAVALIFKTINTTELAGARVWWSR
jgi:hypothetical protein